MRYKVVPDPRDIDAIERAQRAVPLVPDPVEDCCTRIRDELGLPSRDVAREWLTFLQALELVAETDRGFERRRTDPDPDALADAFRRRVFGAEELLDALEAGPITSEEAFDAIRDAIPRWERDRHQDWEREWRTRVERLLAWSVRFGLADREGDRFRRSQG